MRPAATAGNLPFRGRFRRLVLAAAAALLHSPAAGKPAFRDQPPGMSALMISGGSARSPGIRAMAALKWPELTWTSPAAAQPRPAAHLASSLDSSLAALIREDHQARKAAIALSCGAQQ